VSKRIDDKTYEKFKKDVDLLRKGTEYTDERMAITMKTTKGNFSARVKGRVRPGLVFIKRFYANFGELLRNLEEISVVHESDQDFPNTIQLLKEHGRKIEQQGKKVEQLEETILRLEKAITTLVLRLGET
jgi:hypothetical protein